MRQFRPFRLAFVLIAAGEVLSIVWLGKTFGALGALAILVLTGMLGLALIHRSGFGLMRLVGGVSGAGQAKTEAVGSLLAGLAGLLLLMPGLVSDAVALLLLLPVTRKRVAKLFQFDAVILTEPTQAPPAGDIIEGEAIEIIDPDRQIR